jgi:hypothetical protein
MSEIASADCHVLGAFPRAPSNAWTTVLTQDDRDAFVRVHRALLAIVTEVVIPYREEFRTSTTKGFFEKSGVRNNRPKDLWGVILNRDSDQYAGMPQIFIIASGRGLEVGFAPAIHRTDFSELNIKKRLNQVIPTLFGCFPDRGSSVILTIQERLNQSGGWYYRDKVRLNPGEQEFDSLGDLIADIRSPAGIRRGSGAVSRYYAIEELDNPKLSFRALFSEIVDIFHPLMQVISGKYTVRADLLTTAERAKGFSESLEDTGVSQKIPDQSAAPIRVEVRDQRVAREREQDNLLRALERDFTQWREPVVDHIKEALSGDFRLGTNHSRGRDRLIALDALLTGSIADVMERQFRLGYEIERFDGLVSAYHEEGDDMPALHAASLWDIDRLRAALKIGVSKLDRWAEFHRQATEDPKEEGGAKRQELGEALDNMADQLADQPQYFDPELPESFRFLAESVKDPVGATKTVVYGAVKSAENLLSFLAQRALGVGKKAVDAVEENINKAVARTLMLGLGSVALSVSGALPQAWAWLRPVLDTLMKLPTGG